jgi:hypothetical protein
LSLATSAEIVVHVSRAFKLGRVESVKTMLI